ncbi:MAG: chromate resistance protein ChrB domain-containing protein [Nitrososphaerales archaeon]
MAKWITREHVHVDRVACPWLIRKFVDSKAEFLFVPAEEIVKVAKKENATPFDAEGVELGHHGNDCSFETIIKKYKIQDPIVHEVAKIVHSADISKDVDKAPEARGLEAISRGQMFLVKDDYEAIEKGSFLYDCLYMYCKYKLVMKESAKEINNTPKEKRYALIKALVAK